MLIKLKNKETLVIDDFKFNCSVGKKGTKNNKIEGDKATPKGFFSLGEKEISIIKDIFDAEAIDDNETIRIIRDFFNNFGFILDPHTATAVGASYKVKNDLPTVVLGTAHPYKFADTVKLAINREVSTPEQVVALPDKKEKFEILDNNLQKVKNYILEKTQ